MHNSQSIKPQQGTDMITNDCMSHSKALLITLMDAATIFGCLLLNPFIISSYNNIGYNSNTTRGQVRGRREGERAREREREREGEREREREREREKERES